MQYHYLEVDDRLSKVIPSALQLDQRYVIRFDPDMELVFLPGSCEWACRLQEGPLA